MAYFGNKKEDDEPTGAGSFFDRELEPSTLKSLCGTMADNVKDLSVCKSRTVAEQYLRTLKSDIQIIEHHIKNNM